MAIVMKRRKTGVSTSVVSLQDPYSFSSLHKSDNTAHVHALEALLRNPIRFTPATESTNHHKKKMAVSIVDRVSKWKTDRNRREKHRRLVVGDNLSYVALETYANQQMKYLSNAWEPLVMLQGVRSFGLFNTGVTCYRNAALQVLMHLPIFMNWLEDYHHPDDCE